MSNSFEKLIDFTEVSCQLSSGQSKSLPELYKKIFNIIMRPAPALTETTMKNIFVICLLLQVLQASGKIGKFFSSLKANVTLHYNCTNLLHLIKFYFHRKLFIFMPQLFADWTVDAPQWHFEINCCCMLEQWKHFVCFPFSLATCRERFSWS